MVTLLWLAACWHSTVTDSAASCPPDDTSTTGSNADDSSAKDSSAGDTADLPLGYLIEHNLTGQDIADPSWFSASSSELAGTVLRAGERKEYELPEGVANIVWTALDGNECWGMNGVNLRRGDSIEIAITSLPGSRGDMDVGFPGCVYP